MVKGVAPASITGQTVAAVPAMADVGAAGLAAAVLGGLSVKFLSMRLIAPRALLSSARSKRGCSCKGWEDDKGQGELHFLEIEKVR